MSESDREARVRHLTWDRQKGVFVPKDGSKKGMVPKGTETRALNPENEWHRYHYKDMLALAKSCRSPVLAVWAVLHHLHYVSYHKNKPVELGNSILRSLGFDAHAKIRTLKELEQSGLVKVRWRKGKSPLVTLSRTLAPAP